MQIRILNPDPDLVILIEKIIYSFHRKKITFPPCFCWFILRQCYIITQKEKISILCDIVLTVRDKRKLQRVICSWKSERKLWLKFQLNRSIFLFSSLKSVIVNFGFLNLFLDIWIRNPDPVPNTDPDPGSRPKLNADPTGSETLGAIALLYRTYNYSQDTGTARIKCVAFCFCL